jgi:hypothetical protein
LLFYIDACLEGYINTRVVRMGGAFLSQPVTTKKTHKYQHGKLRVVTCEMQGKSL